MSSPNEPKNLSTAELQQMLRERRRTAAQQQLSRVNGEGRIVDVPGALPPPDSAEWAAVVEQTTNLYGRRATRKRRLDQVLFLIELLALIGLGVVAARLWQTNRELNADLAEIQRAQVAQIIQLQAQTRQTVTAVALRPTPPAAATPLAEAAAVVPALGEVDLAPTVATAAVPVATPAIPPSLYVGGAIVLPGGHHPPAPGEEPKPGEAGNIPEELQPTILAHESAPAPDPALIPAAPAEIALRIRIPAIGVDSAVVQGDDWEQLKLGVGQHLGSAPPGQSGNMVLSAHNDIYGEIFRYLERLAPGNEVILSTASRDYTYVVDDARIVAPTDVWIMDPTDVAQVTLITCFPFRINTHRIAIIAHLVDSSS